MPSAWPQLSDPIRDCVRTNMATYLYALFLHSPAPWLKFLLVACKAPMPVPLPAVAASLQFHSVAPVSCIWACKDKARRRERASFSELRPELSHKILHPRYVLTLLMRESSLDLTTSPASTTTSSLRATEHCTPILQVLIFVSLRASCLSYLQSLASRWANIWFRAGAACLFLH